MRLQVYVVFLAIISHCATQDPPLTYCEYCLNRDNTRAFYADLSDCHRYIQCGRQANGNIFAITRNCSPGTYWNDRILTCVRDVDPGTGPEDCRDPCNRALFTTTLALFTESCWFDTAQPCLYYECANTISQPHCCPPGLKFDLPSCSCTNGTADSCPDNSCPLNGFGSWTELIESTTMQPEVLPDNSCIDRRGNHLAPVSTDPIKFVHVLADGSDSQEPITCAPGTAFSVSECDCVTADGNPSPPQQLPACLLHLTLDEPDGKFKDSSVYKHYVHNRGVRSFVGINGIGGVGLFDGGSLLEIPAFQTNDFRNAATFCVSYNCLTADCGGLLSNSQRPVDEFGWSVRLAVVLGGEVKADVQLWHPDGTHTLTQVNVVTLPTGYVHVCGILRDFPSQWELWVNGVLVDETPTNGGDIAIRHCPLTVGSDHTFNNFTGVINEVLVCDHPMDSAQINAHMNGDLTVLRSLDLLPPSQPGVLQPSVIVTSPEGSILTQISVDAYSIKVLAMIKMGEETLHYKVNDIIWERKHYMGEETL